MAHKLPKGSWRVLIRRKGHPKIDRIFETQHDAEQFEAQTRAELDEAASLWSPSMSFGQAARHYLQSLAFQKKTPHTKATERTRLRPVIDALGKYSLESLEDGQHLVRYRDRRAQRVSDRTRRKVQPDSVRLELAAAGAVFGWAVVSNIIVRNPIKRIRRPRAKPRDRRVLDHEYNGITHAMAANSVAKEVREAARFVFIQREIGCRPGELAALRRSDVDLQTWTAKLRNAKNKSKDRIVQLTRLAVEAIASQLAHAARAMPDSEFVFTSESRTGKLPVPVNYRRLIQLLRDEHIVDKDFYAHACRRDYVSSAFESALSHVNDIHTAEKRQYATMQAYNSARAPNTGMRARSDKKTSVRSVDRVRVLAKYLGISLKALTTFIQIERGKRTAPRIKAPQPPYRTDGPKRL